MAKKFGLGGGADILFRQMDDNENIDDSFSVDVSGNNAGFQGGADAESQGGSVEDGAQAFHAARNLPAGLELDDNGQLWARTELLRPNPYQPRQEFNQEQLEELAQSIKEHGILQAVTIEDAEDGTFFIIAGERRTRASKIAGLEKIPVQLRKFDDQKKLEIALIENIQRTDLNPVEEAQAYHKLMLLSGLSQEEVAARVGKNRSTVANAVRLLKLPEDMQNALVKNEITPGHARALLSVKNQTDMRILFGKIIGSSMTVRDAEKLASDMNGEAGGSKPSAPKRAQKDPDLLDTEQKFIEALGTKVEIKGNFDKGTLEISYFSKEDLERIYNLIMKPNL